MTVTHQALVAGMSREEKKALLARSDARGLLRLAGHLGALAATGTLIAIEIPYWPLLLPVHGFMLIFLFTALHETIHKSAFKTERLNDAVAWLSGLAVALPPRWFHYFHMDHHRFTHDPERDPELAMAPPRSLARYLLILSGGPVWLAHARQLLVNAAGRASDRFLPDKQRGAIQREAWIMLAVYALLAGGSAALGTDLLLWVWIAPAILGQPFLRGYLMAEHGLCPHVDNMLENTRTTYTNPVMRFFAWNMPYHAEHHAFPAVPFHNLPRLHAHAAPHLQVTERGYLRFHGDLLRSLGARRSTRDQPA